MLHKWTANWLQNYIPHHSIPTIIAGDWSMRDPSWDDGVPGPTPCTWETLEWLHSLSFNLKMNQMSPQERTAVATDQPLTSFLPMKLHWTLVYYQNYTFTLQSDQWGDRTEPRHTHKNGERATQPEQKFCLRIQTRQGGKDDPRVPRMSSNQNNPCQTNSQQIKTMVDWQPFQSLWRSEEHKGSTQKLDEGIPPSLTLPSRTSHP